MSRLAQRVHRDESGIAMIVMMGVLAIVLILSATAVSVAITAKNGSSRDRNQRRALAAAEAGFRAALYSINQGQTAPLADSACPGGATPSGGWCPSVTDSPALGDGTSYTYFVSTGVVAGATPALSCAGVTPAVDTILRPNIGIDQRCITSTGTVNGVTQRVQARVIADNSETNFPIPGLLGYDHVCLSCNTNGSYTNPTPGAPAGAGCQNRPTTGGQDTVIGLIGSNKAVYGNLSSWSSSGTVTSKYLYVPASNPCVNASNYAANVASWFPAVKPDALQTVPVPFPTPPLDSLFRNPGPDATGGNGTYTTARSACGVASPTTTTPDASTCNDNATGVVAQTTGTNACTNAQANQLDINLHNNRVLSIPPCRVTLATGTYDFCGISPKNNSSQLEPAVTSGAGISVVRILIDSYDRLKADGTHACPASTPEAENGHLVQLGGASFLSTATDPRSAQIFMYGNPSSPNTSQFSFANGTAFSFLFKGPNTVFQVQNAPSGSPASMGGGIAAFGIEFQNNVGFQWDPRVDSITSGGKPVFYKDAWQQCFKPSDLTSPTSGC